MRSQWPFGLRSWPGDAYNQAALQNCQPETSTIHTWCRYCCALALTSAQVEDAANPHGMEYGWRWLARCLNALPASRAAAKALIFFLRAAGFALHRRYGTQCRRGLHPFIKTCWMLTSGWSASPGTQVCNCHVDEQPAVLSCPSCVHLLPLQVPRPVHQAAEVYV